MGHTWINRVGLTAFLIFVCAIFINSCARAQSTYVVVKTEKPDQFASQLVDDLKDDGMSAVRRLFEEMGLNSPQNDAAISVYEQAQNAGDERWSHLIGVVESGEVLKQYYGYAYLGGNGWIFFRLEFLRAGENEWALSNFTFNSEHPAIIGTDLRFVD